MMILLCDQNMNSTIFSRLGLKFDFLVDIIIV